MPSIDREKLRDTKRMRTITGSQWKEAIQKLDKKVETATALVVWFDNFGSRKVKDRWDDLDEYLKAPAFDEPSPEELIEALTKCYYTPERARTRIMGRVK